MDLAGPPEVIGPWLFLSFVRRSDCGLVCVFVETHSDAGWNVLFAGIGWVRVRCLAVSRARKVRRAGSGGAGYLSPWRVFNVRTQRGQGKLGGLAGFLKLRRLEWRQRPGGLSEVGNQAGFAPQKAANVGGRGWLSGLGQGLAFKPPAFQKPVEQTSERGCACVCVCVESVVLFFLPLSLFLSAAGLAGQLDRRSRRGVARGAGEGGAWA